MPVHAAEPQCNNAWPILQAFSGSGRWRPSKTALTYLGGMCSRSSRFSISRARSAALGSRPFASPRREVSSKRSARQRVLKTDSSDCVSARDNLLKIVGLSFDPRMPIRGPLTSAGIDETVLGNSGPIRLGRHSLTSRRGIPESMRRLTLTFAEVAKLYGTGIKRVRDAATRGELPTTELGGKIFVLRSPVEDRLGCKVDLSDDEFMLEVSEECPGSQQIGRR